MTRQNLYQPFEVEIKELTQFPAYRRRNNFFELIYVLDGTGVQFVNENKFSYRKGNLFLLTPIDNYSFDIALPTLFFFLRFNENYISDGNIEYILQNASHRPGCILKNQLDKPLIASLVQNIITEQTNQQIYFSRITEQIISTIITVVARNIALKLPKNIKENTGEPVLEVLHYIQQHIFEPNMLKSEKISRHINMSPNYFGRYFKKQTGETLQDYIIHYKMRLIESRLLNSDMRISEIAYELNFTDESHLNRTFKKFKGMSPSEYRKQLA